MDFEKEPVQSFKKIAGIMPKLSFNISQGQFFCVYLTKLTHLSRISTLSTPGCRVEVSKLRIGFFNLHKSDFPAQATSNRATPAVCMLCVEITCRVQVFPAASVFLENRSNSLL